MLTNPNNGLSLCLRIPHFLNLGTVGTFTEEDKLTHMLFINRLAWGDVSIYGSGDGDTLLRASWVADGFV